MPMPANLFLPTVLTKTYEWRSCQSLHPIFAFLYCVYIYFFFFTNVSFSSRPPRKWILFFSLFFSSSPHIVRVRKKVRLASGISCHPFYFPYVQRCKFSLFIHIHPLTYPFYGAQCLNIHFYRPPYIIKIAFSGAYCFLRVKDTLYTSKYPAPHKSASFGRQRYFFTVRIHISMTAGIKSDQS